MAAEAERLKARQTALLVRCQKARETRRARELAEAKEAIEAAERQKEEADRALLEGAQERVRELREYYDGLSGRSVGSTSIHALRDKEQSLAKAQQEREGVLRAASAAASTARAQAAQAKRAFAQESLRTRKREQLAERAKKAFREAESTAEENAIEEEMMDRVKVMSEA